MSEWMQLEVESGTVTKRITVRKGAQLDEIFIAVAKECTDGCPPSKIRLYSQGRCLSYGDRRSTTDYGLTHLSKLELLVTRSGSTVPLSSIIDGKGDLCPLPGFISVTTTEPDIMMNSTEAPSAEKRAKMPCGHVIGPRSMKTYCQRLLSEGQFKFPCPNCGSQWEYFLVRHVASFTDEEAQDIEKRISDNYLQRAKGYQRCPGCGVLCYRAPGRSGNLVRCPMCKRSFCWSCLRDWVSSRFSRVCGNLDCDGKDEREKVLANCPDKEIVNCTACPSLRACPKCLLLTEHVGCRSGHVLCPFCSHGFCFVCLRSKANDGIWPCSPTGDCQLTPRQISLDSRTQCFIL